jgi:valyl-tRNA synthetase
MSSPGTDIAFNPSRTEGYRAFANKIWNAARFMFMNVDRVAPEMKPATKPASSAAPGVSGFQAVTLEDRWILSRFNRVAADVQASLEIYRFDEAARAIYDFFWGEFCDWYIELLKPRLLEESDLDSARIACANLVNLFESSLRLLHPIMPFITEEIWHAMFDGASPLQSIALAGYPQKDSSQVDLQAETEMAILQDLIVSVRNARAELKVEQKLRVPIQIFAPEANIRNLLERNRSAIERLATVESVAFTEESLSKLTGARHNARFDVHVIYEKKIDVEAERKRLTKEIEQLDKELANGERQLNNDQFLAKAPEKLVEGIRARVAELKVLRQKAQSKLDELPSPSIQ